MALENGIKISELTPVTALLTTDEIPIARSGANAALQGSALQPRLAYPEFTSLYGGASDDFDSLATVGLPVGSFALLRIDVGGGILEAQIWILTASNDDDAAGIVRPDDYHATTNAKAWLRLL